VSKNIWKRYSNGQSGHESTQTVMFRRPSRKVRSSVVFEIVSTVSTGEYTDKHIVHVKLHCCS